MAQETPTVSRRDGTVVWSPLHDIRFFVANKTDLIQRHHYQGEFYEIDDLKLISKYTRPGMIYFDIGSNVGNHALYFSMILQAKEVIVFEPNKPAFDILMLNVLLNRLENINLHHIGKALSDSSGVGSIHTRSENNLGQSILKKGMGEIEIVVGDDEVGNVEVDFIKIDVEGHEMLVLYGLSKCIDGRRPAIFIEVDTRNQDSFEAWCKLKAYVVVDRIKRYNSNENFMIMPAERT